MNLGWYELMDRLAMIQDKLEMSKVKFNGSYEDGGKNV